MPKKLEFYHIETIIQPYLSSNVASINMFEQTVMKGLVLRALQNTF